MVNESSEDCNSEILRKDSSQNVLFIECMAFYMFLTGKRAVVNSVFHLSVYFFRVLSVGVIQTYKKTQNTFESVFPMHLNI